MSVISALSPSSAFDVRVANGYQRARRLSVMLRLRDRAAPSFLCFNYQSASVFLICYIKGVHGDPKIKRPGLAHESCERDGQRKVGLGFLCLSIQRPPVSKLQSNQGRLRSRFIWIINPSSPHAISCERCQVHDSFCGEEDEDNERIMHVLTGGETIGSVTLLVAPKHMFDRNTRDIRERKPSNC
ncbi:hypothetical protein MUK42_32888 [Musa troglodytarum]|uniref:Uncharacterized protein n=1 Tax=Musa troglodytarum TaxID=320322 RepID=A0A9E7I8C4_9LILI|nr:hypothetical protein MUK42_32888 [Musa troglodytarum]